MSRDSDNQAFVKDVQQRLAARGLYAATVDGWAGVKTRTALDTALPPERPPGATQGQPRPWLGTLPVAEVKAAQARWPRHDLASMTAFYGPPGGPKCTAGLVQVPFAFVIPWGGTTTVLRCHERISAALSRVLLEAISHYGAVEFQRLRLHYYGGCYNYRKIRGGSANWSTHAWGAAIDIDPERNQFTWGADKSAFARPEYEAFFNIMEAHGATSAGRAWGKDWMHFQFARTNSA